MSEAILNYIEPELITIIPVLYLIGNAVKTSEKFKDKYIPLIVGACGIILATWRTCLNNGISSGSVLTGICQGILCAAGSVYANQIVKQVKKSE